MTRRTIIIIANILAVMAVVVLVFLIWPRVRQNDQDQETPTPPPAVPIIRDVAEGKLAPAQYANLAFPVSGIVQEILVEEGDGVETGDPLLKLEAASQESDLVQAQTGLVAAESDLGEAEAGLEAALADVPMAELEVLAAEAHLSLLKASASPQEIAAAELHVEAARSGVTQASAGRDARLDVPESQVRDAEAQVSAARAEVEDLQKTYDDIIDLCFELPDGGEVCPLYGTVEENTRAQLKAARLKLNSAQAALDDLNAGATTGQRQAAVGAVTIALANQGLAEAQLNMLLAGPSDEEVRQAEVQVEQAQARVEQVQAAVERARAAVSQAEVGVEIAQAEVDAAQTALDRMTLQALFPGTITTVDVKIGQQVAPAAPVLVLADLNGWLVQTTDLSEQNIAQIEIDAPVEVTIDAISGETLAGTIVDIARVFHSEGGDVIYQVTVDLEQRSDLPLRWGMTAEVDYGA